MGATTSLAGFAAALNFEDILEPARKAAVSCILDSVGCGLFGARLPWGRSVAAYARGHGEGGRSALLEGGARVVAPAAALANGTAIHGFEHDSLRQPGAGVHPGSTAVPAALALAQDAGAGGRALVTAVVAGCEVMFRVGSAAGGSSEKLGFHAPGFTGVFGAVAASGSLLGLDAERMARAFGIAGSLCSGILAFAGSGEGGMVKRLHMGRAAEAGVLAARLAQEGFEGPRSVLETRFGILDVYARNADPAALAAGLGERWETLGICLKKYPCHISSQFPLEALAVLRARTPFDAGEVAGVVLEVGEKVLSKHAEPAPRDTAAAQYSVPFCLALALRRDAADPHSFLSSPHEDPAILAVSRRIALVPRGPGYSGHACRLTIRLADGRSLSVTQTDFPGMPSNPLPPEDLRAKFLRLATCLPRAHAERLYESLLGIEDRDDLRDLLA